MRSGSSQKRRLWLLGHSDDNFCILVADDATGRSSPVAAISIASTLANLKLLSLAVYVAVATGHRFHLFVWSVFSPKLMYELVSTAVHFGLLLVVMFFC